MLTKRNYFVMLLLILVVFVMFMLVDLSAAYLTRDSVNPQAEIPVEITRADAVDADRLMQGTSLAFDRPRVIILVREEDRLTEQILTEWCVYGKHPYEICRALPEVSAVQGCRCLLFGPGMADAEALPTLRAYADAGVDMVFTQLPEVQMLARSPELADFFGISGVQTEAQPYVGVHIFEDFFIGGNRIYQEKDIYGEEDEDVFFAAPWYTLRAGYLVFAQGLVEGGDAIDYADRPPLLWRSYTGRSNVYVNASPLFPGKSLLGLITAFLSQSEAYYLYPVVNAQTLSAVDFPLLADENAPALNAAYSRGAEALGRDVLWPGVAKILHGAEGACGFFMAAELDAADGAAPSGEFLGFYRQEIEQMSGTLGLALNRRGDVPLPDVLAESDAFFAAQMPGYLFTSAYATRDQLPALARAERPASLARLSLVMTDGAEDAPLLDFLDDTVLTACFTSDGFRHESLDDLRLVCLETALALDQQKVDLSKAYYPEKDMDWTELNLRWSNSSTYRKPYGNFDAVSVHEMEKKARTFLRLEYDDTLADGVITLRTVGHEGSSFILRLNGQQLNRTEGAEHRQLSDTAWLILPEEAEVRIHISPRHEVRRIPIFQWELNRQ